MNAPHATSLFDLRGRTALITGSTRGIGLALAQGLAESGARVILNSRQQIAVEAAVAQLQALGLDARGAAFDVADQASVEAAFADFDRTGLAVDILVNKMGRKDVHFGLVGGGTALQEMKDYAKQLGVAEYVTFTGRVPDQDLLDMLNTADVCVNPDEANEMNDKSTMNKIMEYMALGKPIVQFDLTEGRFSAQEASLYAKRNDPQDMANKIAELLDDPAKRQRMGEYGRNRVVNELEWQYEVPKLLKAYDTLWA